MDGIFNLAVIVRAVDQLTGPVRRMAGALQDMDRVAAQGQAMAEWGAKVSIAGAVTQGAANQIWSALMGPVEAAAEFEEAMTLVKAVTAGITGEEFAALEAQAMSLGASTAFSATQAAEGMSFLAKAGFDAQEQMAAMPSMLDLARAGATDLATSADIASNILSGFGLEASEMTRVADVMVATFTTANTDIPMLGDTMKYIAPVARAAGMSLEEAAAMAGLLGNAGIQSSQAGTTLRSMLQRLAAPAGDAAAMLEELGISVADENGDMRNMVTILGEVSAAIDDLGSQQQLEVIGTVFGQEAAAGAAELLNQGVAIQDYVDQLTGSAGRAAQVAAEMSNNYRGMQEELSGAMETLAIQLGTLVIPRLVEFAQWATRVAQGLTQWAEANPGLARIAMTMALIAAGALMIVAPILTVVGGFMTMAGTGLWAIAKIGAGMVWLWPKIAAASKAFLPFIRRMALAAASAVPSFIASIGTMAAALGGRLVMALRAAAVAARAMGLAFLLNPVVLIAAAIAAAAFLVWQNWEPIAAFFTDLWGGVQTAFEGFSSWLSGWWGNITAAFSAASWDGLIPDFDWSALIPPLSWDQFLTALDWLSWLSPLRWLDFIPGFSWAAIVGTVLDWGAWIGQLAWPAFVPGFSWDDAVAVFTWDNVLQVLNWVSWISPLRWLELIPGFSWGAVIDGVLDWGAWVPTLNWGNVLSALDWLSWISPIRWLTFLPAFSWSGIIPDLDWSAIIPAAPDIDWTAVTAAIAVPFETAFGLVDAVWGRLRALFEWSPSGLIADAFSGIGAQISGFISDAADMAGAAWNRVTSIFSDDVVEMAARDPASIERATTAANELAAAMELVAAVDTGPALDGLNAITSAAGEAIARAGGIADAARRAVATGTAVLAGVSFHSHGVAMMTTLAAGIRAGAAEAVAAVQETTQAMRDYLPHSPAKTGPLSDLDRVRFSETLASAIRPGPAIAAVRNLAAGMAAALPALDASLAAQAIGRAAPAPAFVGAPFVPQVGIMPAGVSAGGPAAIGAATPAGMIDVNFQPSITINGTAGPEVRQDLMDQLRAHEHELMQMITDAVARAKRREY